MASTNARTPNTSQYYSVLNHALLQGFRCCRGDTILAITTCYFFLFATGVLRFVHVCNMWASTTTTDFHELLTHPQVVFFLSSPSSYVVGRSNKTDDPYKPRLRLTLLRYWGCKFISRSSVVVDGYTCTSHLRSTFPQLTSTWKFMTVPRLDQIYFYRLNWK